MLTRLGGLAAIAMTIHAGAASAQLRTVHDIPLSLATEAVAAAVALTPEAPVVAVTDASGGCEPEPPDDDIARTPKYAATATTATSAVMAPTMIGLR